MKPAMLKASLRTWKPKPPRLDLLAPKSLIPLDEAGRLQVLDLGRAFSDRPVKTAGHVMRPMRPAEDPPATPQKEAKTLAPARRGGASVTLVVCKVVSLEI